MSTRTMKKSAPTLGGMYVKLKEQMILQLGYSEEQAREEAAKFAGMFHRVFCNNIR